MHRTGRRIPPHLIFGILYCYGLLVIDWFWLVVDDALYLLSFLLLFPLGAIYLTTLLFSIHSLVTRLRTPLHITFVDAVPLIVHLTVASIIIQIPLSTAYLRVRFALERDQYHAQEMDTFRTIFITGALPPRDQHPTSQQTVTTQRYGDGFIIFPIQRGMDQFTGYVYAVQDVPRPLLNTEWDCLVLHRPEPHWFIVDCSRR